MTPSPTNTNLFLHVNHFAEKTDWLHAPMLAMANYGILLFFALLIIGWLYARRQSVAKVGAVVWSGLGTLLAVAVNQPLVHIFRENRPFMNLHDILVLGHHSIDYGFPSDHSTMAGAVATGLFLVNPVLGCIAVVFALLLAFSRVYIAVHYPFDVMAGLLVGAAVMLISYFVVRKLLTFVLTKLLNTPLRLLITAKPVHHEE